MGFWRRRNSKERETSFVELQQHQRRAERTQKLSPDEDLWGHFGTIELGDLLDGESIPDGEEEEEEVNDGLTALQRKHFLFRIALVTKTLRSSLNQFPKYI